MNSIKNFFLILTAIHFVSISISSSLASAKISYSKGQSCHFLCEEVPDADHVLKNWGTSAMPSLGNPKLMVMSWNIYKGRKDYFAQDFAQVSKDMDLILISEGTDGNLVAPSLNKLKGYQWSMGISFLMKENVATGVITGSMAAPTGETYLRTTDLEPWVKSPKVIIVTKYFHQPTSQEILVLNIHGINWVDEQAFFRQIKSTEPLLRAHHGPILFAGDFNIKNPERFQILQNFLGQFGMKRAPWKNPTQGKQLDDAFLRGFDVVQAEIINEVVGRSSDHPLLYMELVPKR